MADKTDAVTRIGSTVVIDGNVSCDEDIAIDGTLKGGIVTSADIYVEAGGTIEAEVETRNIQIEGTLVGNVQASDQFVLMPDGKMIGDVKAPRVVISDGAKFKGNIEMEEK
jgi:cytoskeletal protein CcmA (bactofilin family)